MNLILDGNYLLYRNVFSLIRDKMLYGYLQDSLEKSVESYSRWYPFEDIYFVSDSKTNWRKNVYTDYKGNRKKDDKIDWEFVNTVYDEYKQHLPKRIKLLEKPLVEGDDWIGYITHRSNKQGKSVLIVSNDGDLKQLLRTGRNYINLMVNENNTHNYLFVPVNYKTWLSNFNDTIELPGLFDDDISSDLEMYKFIKSLSDQREIQYVKKDKILFEKLLAGDRGDNIKSVYIKNNRGIGEKTAEKIYDLYVEYFGSPEFDEECFNRMVDLVIEKKKLNTDDFDLIHKNIELNNKIINLSNIPKEIIKTMNEYYGDNY